MSHTEFETAFELFRQKFPPAEDPGTARLKLTTEELRKTFTDLFDDDIEIPERLFSFLTGQGYRYEPIEQNDQVRFYWLLKG